MIKFNAQPADEGMPCIGAVQVATQQRHEPFSLKALLADYLNKKLEGTDVNQDGHFFHFEFEALESDPGTLMLKMRVGPPPGSVINPLHARDAGLLYNPDAIQEEFLIKQFTEAASFSHSCIGSIGKAIIDGVKQLGTTFKPRNVSVHGFEIEYAEYFQMLTRWYPEDYPEEMKRKATVHFGRPVLYLTVHL